MFHAISAENYSFTSNQVDLKRWKTLFSMSELGKMEGEH